MFISKKYFKNKKKLKTALTLVKFLKFNRYENFTKNNINLDQKKSLFTLKTFKILARLRSNLDFITFKN